jgi:hypothetical protein
MQVVFAPDACVGRPFARRGPGTKPLISGLPNKQPSPKEASLTKAQRTPEDIEKLNRKISRAEEAEPRKGGTARVLNPAALPEAAALRIQAEEGEARSETEQALRRATKTRKP